MLKMQEKPSASRGELKCQLWICCKIKRNGCQTRIHELPSCNSKIRRNKSNRVDVKIIIDGREIENPRNTIKRRLYSIKGKEIK